jgi:phytanoyl-CoA hydroxylase
MAGSETDGDGYPLTQAQIGAFVRAGWVHLPGLLSAAEVAALEGAYMALLRREIPVPGRDYCDMSGDYTRPIEDFSVLNVMLPGVYHPTLRGNRYERRAADVARQLRGDGMELDYDQLVAKPPRKPDAVFHWHQDLAYWPDLPDSRTASFWLALDVVDVDNGGVRFVDGSHREPDLRAHRPLHGDRDRSHVMAARVDQGRDRIRSVRLEPGDATVHHERTLHGSSGNTSDRWRRGWVVAFRSGATVAAERAMGFTHSHNDDLEVLRGIAGVRGR